MCAVATIGGAAPCRDPIWMPTVFTHTRSYLLNTKISRKAMAAIIAHRKVMPLLSDDHFPADGTSVMAWASVKSFRPKAEDSQRDDGPGGPDACDRSRKASGHDRSCTMGLQPVAAPWLDLRQACVTPPVARDRRAMQQSTSAPPGTRVTSSPSGTAADLACTCGGWSCSPPLA